MNPAEKILKAASDGIGACMEMGGGDVGVSACIAPEGRDGIIAVALFVTDPQKAAAIKAEWDKIDND